MEFETDDFKCSGPSWLTCVDWSSPNDRRSVAASLVKGVYVLENHRQQKRKGRPNTLSPFWWTFFNFKIFQELKDESDNSIFGVIFKFDAQLSHYTHLNLKPPTYVVAFRGTLTKSETRRRDFTLDFQIFINELHNSTRFNDGLHIVESMLRDVRGENVWLVGHSLGSSIAMLVGKKMAKMGHSIESFLFNPPFPNAPIERIKPKKLKLGIHFVSSVAKATLAVCVNELHKNDHTDGYNNSFFELSGWMPSLFVNKADPICSRYMAYFENREKMVEIGAGGLEWLSTQNSFRSLFLNRMGRDSLPAHVIPSAYLVTNQNPPINPISAHGINLWWAPDINCQIKPHKWRSQDFSRLALRDE